MTFRLFVTLSSLNLIAVPATQLAAQASRYTVADLGTFGGSSSIAFGINNAGHVAGGASLPGGNQHGALWAMGIMTDTGTLGGPNSSASGPNGNDAMAVYSDTAVPDPLGEDFCNFGTHVICTSALWSNGTLTPLPTLGGNNSQVLAINSRGQMAGISEKSRTDTTCPAPQKLRYSAALWGANPNQVDELPPLPGDTVGFALGLNDLGQVVGSTGTCANTIVAGLEIGPHAVLWQNGAPIEVGGFGGSVSVAAAINNRGEVVGASNLAGDSATPGFFWTQEAGMRKIGAVGTDLSGLPTSINNRGQVVGASCSGVSGSGDCRAFLWENGTMADLNTLAPSNSPIYMLFALMINDSGEIVGLGLTSAFEVHAFLATPCYECSATAETYGNRLSASNRPSTPENARRVLQRRYGMHKR